MTEHRVRKLMFAVFGLVCFAVGLGIGQVWPTFANTAEIVSVLLCLLIVGILA